MISGNTFYDNGYTQLFYMNYSGTRSMYNNSVNNNIFFSKTSVEYVTKMLSANYTIDEAALLGDYNYYTRPIADNTTMYLSSLITLATFKATVTPQETHSAKSTATVTTTDDIHFIYNATKAIKYYTLSATMVDVANVSYSGNIPLNPYSSLILMGVGTVSPTLPSQTYLLIRNPSGKLIRDSNGKVLRTEQ